MKLSKTNYIHNKSVERLAIVVYNYSYIVTIEKFSDSLIRNVEMTQRAGTSMLKAYYRLVLSVCVYIIMLDYFLLNCNNYSAYN